jgi:hypothetical protein
MKIAETHMRNHMIGHGSNALFFHFSSHIISILRIYSKKLTFAKQNYIKLVYTKYMQPNTSRTGFGVKSGSRASCLADGARSSIFTRLSAASCCCSFGCHEAGKLLKDGN